ncbi:MAG: 4a-hydroxytetrahydrobiopterin dehydratase [Candidatus Paceibacterota bacterium]|jgi:4a-hydroxytetrahydrobiopterin dehydratase
MEDDLRALGEEEIEKRLKSLPGWAFAEDKIRKEFKFSAFKKGIELVDKLAPFCDKIDHHPDIHIYYKKIVFELQRFSAGGKVTPRDFVVAQEIERLYNLANG